MWRAEEKRNIIENFNQLIDQVVPDQNKNKQGILAKSMIIF